ncbi:TPA: YihA family ribosome biogenesis GTP-binding protein, partial [Campylobacter jejuni]|nr:YihA family ribosome biogenesis GTP-binding protein [Campylobacter jejuni]EDP2904633.1 YihA family ribosome biogenesis GTP-binding protein [Campylobacter jejuni]EGH7616735.1 YihA family ribosome biogenesis GTP-binding protein [Campylobacter jejuni]ELM9469466.1 YihA family ribosome biogenesis GTP-binding protein [Campylobacter jejuni]
CDKLNQSEKAKLKNEFKDSILVSNLNKFGLDSLEDIIINQTLGLDK